MGRRHASAAEQGARVLPNAACTHTQATPGQQERQRAGDRTSRDRACVGCRSRSGFPRLEACMAACSSRVRRGTRTRRQPLRRWPKSETTGQSRARVGSECQRGAPWTGSSASRSATGGATTRFWTPTTRPTNCRPEAPVWGGGGGGWEGGGGFWEGRRGGRFPRGGVSGTKWAGWLHNPCRLGGPQPRRPRRLLAPWAHTFDKGEAEGARGGGGGSWRPGTGGVAPPPLCPGGVVGAPARPRAGCRWGYGCSRGGGGGVVARPVLSGSLMLYHGGGGGQRPKRCLWTSERPPSLGCFDTCAHSMQDLNGLTCQPV